MPPGPAMFSMTKRWPSFSPSFSVTSRAVTSATPPAPNGRINRTGPGGELCASAICGSNNAATSAAIPANDTPRRPIVYRLSAIARAPSKLEQPRRIVDQYLLLQFGLRRKQRNQVDQIAVVGHHLDIGVRPVGPPDHAIGRGLDNTPRERHRVMERRSAGGHPLAAAHLDPAFLVALHQLDQRAER